MKPRTPFSIRYVKPPKAVNIPDFLLKYSHAKQLVDDIDIQKESRFFVIINGTFIFGDFIEALIVENNYHVKKMTISTLSLSENNVDSLANLLNGGFVDELNLIVSDYFYSHERNSLIPYIYKELDKKDKFQFAAAGTHCKTCNIETYDGLKIIIHGSANLRSSGNIEQICIEENEMIYDFNDQYQDRILEKYKTIKKSIRSEKAWNLIINPDDIANTKNNYF